MLIANLLVAGSIAYVGAKLLALKLGVVARGRLPTAFFVPVVVTAAAPSSHPDLEPARFAAGAATVEPPAASAGQPGAEQRYRYAAATSVCLAAGGAAVPVLNVVSVPLTVYSMTPLLEAGAMALFLQGKLTPAAFSSSFTIGALLTQYYLPAAALPWLHHGWRYWRPLLQGAVQKKTVEFADAFGDLATQAMGGPPPMMWAIRDGIEVQTPYAQLQIGDVIAIGEGEFVPVDGLITVGSATVNTLLRNGVGSLLAVGEGDRLSARTFVTEGRIQIQIERFVP